MPIKIPSPVLARLQVMLAAGATMEDAAKALEIDMPSDGDAAPEGFAARARHLRSLSQDLREQVTALLNMDGLKDRPEIAGAADLIAQRAGSIIREIDIIEEPYEEPHETTSVPEKESLIKKSPAKPSSARSTESEITKEKASGLDAPSKSESKPTSDSRPKGHTPPPESPSTARLASSAPQPSNTDETSPLEAAQPVRDASPDQSKLSSPPALRPEPRQISRQTPRVPVVAKKPASEEAAPRKPAPLVDEKPVTGAAGEGAAEAILTASKIPIIENAPQEQGGENDKTPGPAQRERKGSDLDTKITAAMSQIHIIASQHDEPSISAKE